MAKTLKLEIVSAEASLYAGEAEMVMVTGNVGELGIYPGHTALITPIKPGQVKALLSDHKEEVFYISGGMLEVQPDVVTILADTALRAADIDESAALAAKERAERAMHDKSAKLEYSQAVAELAKAAAQLQAIKMMRKKHSH